MLQGTMFRRQSKQLRHPLLITTAARLRLRVADHDPNLLRRRLQMLLQSRHQFHEVAGAMAIIQL